MEEATPVSSASSSASGTGRRSSTTRSASTSRPIFVAREWFRHRIGSFNEFSMRYAKATDEFYVPGPEDVRRRSASRAPTPSSLSRTRSRRRPRRARPVYAAAYAAYERLVEMGVARELARAVMPVGAYTEFYWTVTARALMNFVSLRAARRLSARSGATRMPSSSSSRSG